MRQLRYLVVALLAFALAPAAGATMYKWVDADGNVVYSDKPPPDGNAEEVKRHATGTTDEEAEATLEALTDKADAEREDREIKNEIASDQAERGDIIKKNCEIARKNKSLLETPARVTLQDAEGNDYFLDEQERTEKLKDATAQVERYCN